MEVADSRDVADNVICRKWHSKSSIRRPSRALAVMVWQSRQTHQLCSVGPSGTWTYLEAPSQMSSVLDGLKQSRLAAIHAFTASTQSDSRDITDMDSDGTAWSYSCRSSA